MSFDRGRDCVAEYEDLVYLWEERLTPSLKSE